MMIASQPSVRTLARNTQAAPAPPADSNPPAPPADSFGGKIGKKALQTGIAWGNATGTVVGGAGGLSTAMAGLYVGVLGGAVVGATLGGGIGPMLGAVSGKGALGFLGTTFSTMGTAAKAGVLLGGLAGGAGAFSIGNSVGNLAGKVVGFPLGAAVGAAQGIGQAAEDAATGGSSTTTGTGGGPGHTNHKTDLNKMNGITATAAAVVSGVGLLSGASGGFIAGAGVASTGNLVSGLLARNVSLSAIGGAALTGGIVGAAVFGVIGGVGGWKLVKGTQKVVGWVSDKISSNNTPPTPPTPPAPPAAK